MWTLGWFAGSTFPAVPSFPERLEPPASAAGCAIATVIGAVIGKEVAGGIVGIAKAAGAGALVAASLATVPVAVISVVGSIFS